MLKYRYYFLILNIYDEPNGDVEEAYLTDEEAQNWRDAGRDLFKTYEEAKEKATA